ncbi:uncharacterized protein LOC107811237 [Nicotiana tabacum]|uniref:Uncharacterized protein n=2 Tax=Nicotiana tabacum TaxID=4097 RepID=A0A1S4BRU3_TOBAC|nr:PREDICTED: uncharacterized protein LOC107811237 [Nicotiana tabacum]XP_016491609.1 PREDICTED: uncharacterized protein LOC107811237 [Nicotiana tabacum]XP_016491610.1 PREDICTED: uncharacterized protein LOC107811237 [Nicotiana tabacum]
MRAMHSLRREFHFFLKDIDILTTSVPFMIIGVTTNIFFDQLKKFQHDVNQMYGSDKIKDDVVHRASCIKKLPALFDISPCWQRIASLSSLLSRKEGGPELS